MKLAPVQFSHVNTPWGKFQHLVKIFQLRRPQLKNGHPKRNFREPMSLPNILAELPRPSSWSHEYI